MANIPQWTQWACQDKPAENQTCQDKPATAHTCEDKPADEYECWVPYSFWSLDSEPVTTIWQWDDNYGMRF